VIGIDSYHDSSARGKSAGGFVASVNATLTRSVTKNPCVLVTICVVTLLHAHL